MDSRHYVLTFSCPPPQGRSADERNEPGAGELQASYFLRGLRPGTCLSWPGW